MITMAGAIPLLHLYPTTPLPSRTYLRHTSPPRFRPPVAATPGGSSYWATLDAEIENHLRQAIQVKQPLSVYEPLHYFAFTAPANTSPSLCVASFDLFGGHNRDKAMAAASALRLYHNAVYAHGQLLEGHGPKSLDDEPCGPNIKLLTGHGLLSLAMELLVRSDDPGSNNSGRILRVMIELNRALGSQGVVEGKYQETIRRRSSDGEGLRLRHVEEICKVSEKIEGRFHACAAACGAIIGGGNDDEIDKLRNYGVKVGTIQGLVSRSGTEEEEEYGDIMKKVEELRDLAIKELKDFEGKDIDALYGLCG